MFITIVFSLMCLAIVALGIFSYTLSVKIKDLKLTVDVSRIAFRDRFRSVEERLDDISDISKGLFNISGNLIDLAKIHRDRLDSLEFNQKLHSQQIKVIKVIMWD